MPSKTDGSVLNHLAFAMYPTRDVHRAVEFYREALGAEARWWPDENTALLQTPGAQRPDIMVEQDAFECTIGAGTVFLVTNVDEYYGTWKHAFTWVLPPCDVPPGRYAVYQDHDGSPVRIFDLSNDTFPQRSLLGAR
ncbi:VOC family protein [Sulfobacillus harzensis]|uniref:Glyoxalase/fosfomycin resistance/dioxygenase domain-containing protein n=1 Tax=Sulfobacillus harzensis TaxID=2729629 RepID=A0A7Y0L7Y5_9FIRM|nr:VOC family protein [Sulfobacillus harzensis]NMP24974.1 hypothetical protein [Sulfobacillus harzensis]